MINLFFRNKKSKSKDKPLMNNKLYLTKNGNSLIVGNAINSKLYKTKNPTEGNFFLGFSSHNKIENNKIENK